MANVPNTPSESTGPAERRMRRQPVLASTEIKSRAGTILEGEAGVNDAAGIALMIGMVELVTHADTSFTVVIVEFTREMTVGLALGFVAASVLAPVVTGLRLPSEDLRPVLLIALAVVLYAVTALLGGSGFLAVFVFGLMLGDARSLTRERSSASTGHSRAWPRSSSSSRSD